MYNCYSIFIDFPNGTNEAVAQKYTDYSQCVKYADNLQNMINIQGLNVSVWHAGKCYYSTDINVKLDGFPD